VSRYYSPCYFSVATAIIVCCAIFESVFVNTAAGIVADVAGIGADNTTAGIRRFTTAVEVFTDVCGLRALAHGRTRQV